MAKVGIKGENRAFFFNYFLHFSTKIRFYREYRNPLILIGYKRSAEQQKPMLFKQGFFGLQTRLLWSANKACFECKQGLFSIRLNHASFSASVQYSHQSRPTPCRSGFEAGARTARNMTQCFRFVSGNGLHRAQNFHFVQEE